MLRGERIALAPLRDADLPQLFTWINERDEVLLNARYRPVHEADHRAWFEHIRCRDDIAIFGIRLLAKDTLIGSCQLSAIDPYHGTAELQIRIGSVAERGQGYGGEAVGLLLRHAFRDLRLRRVQLHAFASNEAALRCYGRAGLTREGVLRRAAFIDGCVVDIVLMGVLREEFEAITDD